MRSNNGDLDIGGAAGIGGNLVVQSQGDINFGTTTNITGNVTVTGSNSDLNFGSGQSTVGGAVLIQSQGDITGGGVLGFGSINITGFNSNICTLGQSDVIPNPVDLVTCTAGVLPITLTFVNAEYVEGHFLFTWQTLAEENNDFFTIEYSYDAQVFATLTDPIDGAGTSFEPIDYRYLEEGFVSEQAVIYFRLKQTDFDGQFSYSSVVPLLLSDWTDPTEFKLYPNPVSDAAIISLPSFDSERTYVAELINTISQVKEEYTLEGVNTHIDMSWLPAGIYILNIEGFQPIKVVVQ